MNFIKFLGTAGARFVMIRQLRASGGIWIKFKTTNILVDPGPGSIVRCSASKPKLDPISLDAIILTHKHLDHSGDVNVMIEAMTQGRLKRRGVLFLPHDSLGKEGVIFPYLKKSLSKISFLEKGGFSIGDIAFEAPVQNIHPVQTYGLKFYLGNNIISFISDTKYFDKILDIYKDSTLIVLNVVFYQRNENFEHLCLEDAVKIIKKIKPKKAILTHFGMSMLKQKPYMLEKKIKQDLNMDIKFAYDGLNIEIPI